MKVKVLHGFTDSTTGKNYQDNEIIELSDNIAKELEGSFIEPFNESVIEKDSKEYEYEIKELQEAIVKKDNKIKELQEAIDKLKSKESKNKKQESELYEKSSKKDDEVTNSGEIQE